MNLQWLILPAKNTLRTGLETITGNCKDEIVCVFIDWSRDVSISDEDTTQQNVAPVQSQVRCDTAFHSSETVLISEDWKD